MADPTGTTPARLLPFLRSGGRTVIVPIDHGTAIPVPGLEHPADLIEALKPFADAFVVNYGTALACRDALAHPYFKEDD